MYPNLRAEQARLKLSNQDVADELGLSRAAYEYKKKSGRFYFNEAKKLCHLFGCEFSYLFASEDD